MSAHSRSSSGSRRLRLSLLLKFFAFAALLPGTASTCRAQDKVELFGGYSYYRASIREQQLSPGTPCPPNCTVTTLVSPHANLNGWEFNRAFGGPTLYCLFIRTVSPFTRI